MLVKSWSKRCCRTCSTISRMRCSMLLGWSPTGTLVMPGRSISVMVLQGGSTHSVTSIASVLAGSNRSHSNRLGMLLAAGSSFHSRRLCKHINHRCPPHNQNPCGTPCLHQQHSQHVWAEDLEPGGLARTQHIIHVPPKNPQHTCQQRSSQHGCHRTQLTEHEG